MKWRAVLRLDNSAQRLKPRQALNCPGLFLAHSPRNRLHCAMPNDMDSPVKTCVDCNETKPADQFIKLRRLCKPCGNARKRAGYVPKPTNTASLTMARACGLTHYHSALPCKHGHVGLRLVSTQQCCACLRIRKLAMFDQAQIAIRRKGAIRRRFARNLGKTRYESQAPCKRGHPGTRLVSTGQCVDCLSEREKTKGTSSAESIEKCRRRSNAKRRSREGRIKQREYYRDSLSQRLDFRLTAFMRACLRRARLSKNDIRTFDILGFTWMELKSHLEDLFRDGMSWENYGEWHIDHVRPIRIFLQDGQSDPKVVNALSNLQPLWQLENLSKGSKPSA